MKLSLLAPAALAALLLAAPAAWAEEAASPEPEFLPDESYEWIGSIDRAGASVRTTDFLPYYTGIGLHIHCLRWPPTGVVSGLTVSFGFGWYTLPRGAPTTAVRVGFWSRLKLARGEGYILHHDVEIYESVERHYFENLSQLTGPAAHDLVRKIYRADSVSWTDLTTGRASRPHPVTDRGRALLKRLMDVCEISHEPAP